MQRNILYVKNSAMFNFGVDYLKKIFSPTIKKICKFNLKRLKCKQSV